MDRGPLRPNRMDWIGKALRRVEDERLITGSGRFVDDITPPDCLFVEFVRSSYACGKLGPLNLESVRRAPGILAVFSAADVRHLDGLTVNKLLPEIRVPEPAYLADHDIRAVGQPVVMIVGTSKQAVLAASHLVVIDVEEGVVDEMSPEAISHTWSEGNIDGAFAAAAHVVHARIEHPRVAPFALEPRAALVSWDNENQSLTAWLSTQTPYRSKLELCRILKLHEDQVRVISPDVGGAFGGKASIYPEDVLVAFAARQLGRPVKWCATRSEDMMSATQGRGATTEAELAVDADGRFLGLRARLHFPLGFWLPYSAAAPGNNAGRILPGPYKVDALHVDLRADVSNTAAVNIYRGAGRPEAAILMERLVEQAARELGKDPIELRRLNLIQPHEFPYRTKAGQILDSGEYPALLDLAERHSSYVKLRQETAAERKQGAICGIGVAFYIEPCGQGFESAAVKVDSDGHIVVSTGATSQGQGRETAYSQIAADVLGVPPCNVLVMHGDTSECPPGTGALASRSTAIGGSAVLLALDKFIRNARWLAAEAMGAQPQDVVLSAGEFENVSSGDRVTWAELARYAREHPERQLLLSAEAIFKTDNEAWSSGCCITKVRIDAETGGLTIERVSWVDDAGVIVNPMLLKGQLVGGMAQGLGATMMERIVYDEGGQLLTGSLMDYALPRADDIPAVEIVSMETPSPTNELGAKGAGEAGCIGVPAAIYNAVFDALGAIGVEQVELPFTSFNIWNALRLAGNLKDRK